MLCDNEKIKQIRSTQISESLWNNTTLQDPCPSGMLPYYLAFAYSQPGQERVKASEYYKIASMNHDGPVASRTLSILALSGEGDYLASALSFALVGATGYDPYPYICQDLADTIGRDIATMRKADTEWITELKDQEKSLKDTKDTKNPISQSSNNCYDMVTRSIESIMLSHIAERARGSTAKTGDDLIRLGILQEIPTLSSKS
jgi:DNA-binding protein Fis